jgi:hypothetical protein
MKIRFLQSGESPLLGAFVSGEVRDIAEGLEKDFIKRGVAERVGDKPKKKREVKADGGE